MDFFGVTAFLVATDFFVATAFLVARTFLGVVAFFVVVTLGVGLADAAKDGLGAKH